MKIRIDTIGHWFMIYIGEYGQYQLIPTANHTDTAIVRDCHVNPGFGWLEGYDFGKPQPMQQVFKDIAKHYVEKYEI